METVEIRSQQLNTYIQFLQHHEIVQRCKRTVALAEEAITAARIQMSSGQVDKQASMVRITNLLEAKSMAIGQLRHSMRQVQHLGVLVKTVEEYWRTQEPCKN